MRPLAWHRYSERETDWQVCEGNIGHKKSNGHFYLSSSTYLPEKLNSFSPLLPCHWPQLCLKEVFLGNFGAFLENG